MNNLKDKTVIVTGAGSGIGRSLARLMAAEGCHLALNDLDPVSLEETVTSLNLAATQQVMSVAFDVSDLSAMQSFADEALAKFKSVDVVINNAGVALGRSSVDDLSYEDLDWIMGINFRAMVYGTKLFLPHLKSRPEAALVNISSVFGLAGIGMQSAYCSSKFAIRGFTESLRMEAQAGFPHVTVMCVHPSGVKTNIAKNARPAAGVESHAEHRMQVEQFEQAFRTSADATAIAIVRGVKRRKSRVMVGYGSRVMDWLARLLPVGYTGIMRREIKKRMGTEL